MLRINMKFNPIIRVLLIIGIVFGFANILIGKGDIWYYVTETIEWVSLFGAFVLIIIKNEIKDRIFKKEWA